VREIGPTRLSARLTVTPDGFRFRQPGQALILGALVGFTFVLSISGSVDAFTRAHGSYQLASKIAYPFLVLFIGLFLIQIARSGTLIASRSGVVVRNLLRTHRLDWSKMARFEEKVAPIGASGVPRRFLRVHLTDGKFKNFTELNDSQRRNPDVVAELVKRLGAMKKSADAQAHRLAVEK
jgi:hypothetical protein